MKMEYKNDQEYKFWMFELSNKYKNMIWNYETIT